MRTSALALAAGLWLSPALLLAQEPTPPPAPAPQTRELSHTSEDGTVTTLRATPEGGSWKIEMTRKQEREGRRSQQQAQVMVQRTPELDRALDELFQHGGGDPGAWEEKLEGLGRFRLHLGHEDHDGEHDDHGDHGWGGIDELRELPERVQERVRRARERLERSLQGGFEGFRDLEPFEELRDFAAARRGPSTDRVHLENGDLVSGDVLALDATSLKVKTPHGELVIPREQVRRIELKRPARGVLGVSLDEAEGGARVEEVAPDSGAAQAGMAPGDLVTAVAGQPVGGPGDLRRLLAGKKPGEVVAVTIKRGEKSLELQVTLGAEPR